MAGARTRRQVAARRPAPAWTPACAGEQAPGVQVVPVRVGVALLCLAAAGLFCWDLRGLGFLDNEGRYAEVAREMLATGDWITPHLNGEVFLNKPPLVFWLTALAFRCFGFTEAARVMPALAALLTVPVLYDLGRRIWSERAGWWSAAAFVAGSFTVIEARTLRPDPFVVLFLCVSLWGAARIAEYRRGVDPGGRHWGPAALWTGIGLGIMAKGFLALALPVLALLPALALAGRLRDLRHYAPPWALALAALLVAPWHLAAGLANRGFWWDYVVNQHLLVFFDRKFPRDHIPHPLGYAWGMFAARLFPWLPFLPTAVVRQFHAARAERSVAQWLPLTWFGSIWLFFSLTSARLEHYFLPAIPAAALLAGRLIDRWTEPGAKQPRWRLAPFALLGLLGVIGLGAAPAALRGAGILERAPALLPAALAAMTAVALGGFAAMALQRSGRPSAAFAAVAASFLVFGGAAVSGLRAIDPLRSARFTLERVDPRLLAESEIAYEAGDEYQLCGVIGFYTGRHVVLPEPPGFIPPTYLQGLLGRVFVPRERFRAAWGRGERRYLMFTNPEKALDRPAELPQPYYEVARGGGRLVITNLPLPLSR